MRLWRVLPWDPAADATWFPRPLQGSGRHDHPDRYGCLYVSETPVSAIAEALAPFRGTGDLGAELLVRGGRPLALAALELRDGAMLVDLDDPAVLDAERLRPSLVASHARARTQAYALALFADRPAAVGLRWWSTLESTWINVTLFDRAGPALAVAAVDPLAPDDADVQAAAAFLGLL